MRVRKDFLNSVVKNNDQITTVYSCDLGNDVHMYWLIFDCEGKILAAPYYTEHDKVQYNWEEKDGKIFCLKAQKVFGKWQILPDSNS